MRIATNTRSSLDFIIIGVYYQSHPTSRFCYGAPMRAGADGLYRQGQQRTKQTRLFCFARLTMFPTELAVRPFPNSLLFYFLVHISFLLKNAKYAATLPLFLASVPLVCSRSEWYDTVSAAANQLEKERKEMKLLTRFGRPLTCPCDFVRSSRA